MPELSSYVLCAVLIGAIATALLDLWALARRRLQGGAAIDYGLVGRWLAYLMRGRFKHHPIAASPPIKGERVIGWTAHYAIGVAFAGILLSHWGLHWVHQPTIGPALIVGIGSVAAPFLLLQPGMGAGIAASRTPNPTAARVRSLITHTIFGLGLYASGWIARWLTSAG
jgi:hypothetical protein